MLNQASSSTPGFGDVLIGGLDTALTTGNIYLNNLLNGQPSNTTLPVNSTGTSTKPKVNLGEVVLFAVVVGGVVWVVKKAVA